MPYQKNNRWYTEVWDNYNKNRIRRVVRVPGKRPEDVTRADALKVEKLIRGEIEKGTFNLLTSRQKVNLEKLIYRFLEWSKENKVSYPTDKSICKNLLNFFGNKNIKDMNLWDIEQFKQYRKKQKRTPETINKDLGCLRRMMNLAVKWGLIDENPIKGMELLIVPERKYRVLKEWEVEKLYEVAPQHFKPIILFAYFTGCRNSEIQTLKWENIDFELGEITIEGKDTKNSEYKTLPMNSSLRELLSEMSKNSNCEYVFTTQHGKPYTGNTPWKKAWQSTLKKSGIDYCRFYDLRHTFCSTLVIDEKVDLRTVMALSGHKDPKILLKRYSHTKEEAKKDAMKKLENKLNLKNFATSIATNDENDNIIKLADNS